jgi:bisphosphoglycerate-dependent phosphoglycerate mutase family 1
MRDTMVHFKVLTKLKPLKNTVKHKLKSGEDLTLPLLLLLSLQMRDSPATTADTRASLHPLFPELKLFLTALLEFPYWYDQIVPQVLDGKNVLVVAHGNSIRSIVKHIDNISETDIIGVNIPTSVPLIYEFDANFKPVKNYYLADPEELKKKQEAVSNQGKKK